jgi:fatty-acyl-CoA synthase
VSDRHLRFSPARSTPRLDLPATSLVRNAQVSAQRFPGKPFLIFYDTSVTFAEFLCEVERIAGFLERECGVVRGDRVLLYMQNSPQFVIGYYGILRANAVVVPVNPMSLTHELARYAEDAGAATVIVAQDLFARVEPLLSAATGLRHAIVTAYSDYLKQPTSLTVPDFVAAPRAALAGRGVTTWSRALELDRKPGPLSSRPDDLCVMPYTSGTTGVPRGCMHTHRTTMYTAVAGMRWFDIEPERIFLSVAPFFHVTGMQGSMNGPLYAGCSIVLLPRWDREAAAVCIERYRITGLSTIPTMVQDFLSNPDLGRYDLSSLRYMSGGGSAMPAAVAQRLENMGVPFVEGYGLSETMAPTHCNPPDRPKKQCLGIPIYEVDSRVVDPETLNELPEGETGEIVSHGPQVFLGYWNNPGATAAAFASIEGKRFLRTGDLGRIDEDGYFFMVDRLKRMINAAGFKVWPAEVESLMYRHPAVQEACVIAAREARRGETVKAMVVLKADWRGRVAEAEIIAWCREHMAAYKIPRLIEFADSLPKSGAGKILWRELQEREYARESTAQSTTRGS